MEKYRIGFVILVVSLLVCAVPFRGAASIVSDWNAVVLGLAPASKMGPPIVARAYAIVHTCMYDAWAMYDDHAVGTVLGHPERRPKRERTEARKAEAVSYAAYQCALNLFGDSARFPASAPAATAALTAYMVFLAYDPENQSLDRSTAAGLGNYAAAAVIRNRAVDGSNQYGTLAKGAYADYTGYVPRNAALAYCLPTSDACDPFHVDDPEHWQPLIGPPHLGSVTQVFIAPHWENVRPFALRSAEQLDWLIPPPEVQRNGEHYRRNAEKVLEYSREITTERKVIVEYWADGPGSALPAGHWGVFAQFVSKRDHHTLDQDMKMFFALHNASFDAGIVAWHIKREYDGVRPITAIRHLFEGQSIEAWGGPGRPVEYIPGESWSPYNPGSNLTPSFPGYISGHAIFSSASALILRRFTGSDSFDYLEVVPANSFNRVEANIPPQDTEIRFATFTEAADEASRSRLYGGIHFEDDCIIGLQIGELVGSSAWSKVQRLFRGIPLR